MQSKWPWFERKFEFNFPAEKLPDIVERLRGTPARIVALTDGLATSKLQQREDETWSIQENVGHLADAEPLWLGRVGDIISGHATMREADLTNRKTFEANHHQAEFEETAAQFARLRREMIRQLESLDPRQNSSSALHPRLLMPMRIVDLAYFVAEHDDYHLARIHFLKQLSPAK